MVSSGISSQLVNLGILMALLSIYRSVYISCPDVEYDEDFTEPSWRVRLYPFVSKYLRP